MSDNDKKKKKLKKALLKMARSGANRPSYDPDFDKKIRALRPDWFEKK